MSEFTKMASGGMSEQHPLLQLLKKARDDKGSEITVDQIIKACECSEGLPRRDKPYFSSARRTVVMSVRSSRGEERLAKVLYLLGELKLQNDTKLRFLDYQVPLKRVRKDKAVGKIDLVGCVDDRSLALVELKMADSTENPRVALLEILTYGAIVMANIEAINCEIAKTFHRNLSKAVQLIILGLRGIEWANLGYEGPRKLCIS